MSQKNVIGANQSSLRYLAAINGLSRAWIFSVTSRCFRRRIPVTLFSILSRNIRLPCYPVEICETSELSATQFSANRYLRVDVTVSPAYFSSVFQRDRLLSYRIIDSVRYIDRCYAEQTISAVSTFIERYISVQIKNKKKNKNTDTNESAQRLFRSDSFAFRIVDFIEFQPNLSDSAKSYSDLRFAGTNLPRCS